MTRLAAGQKAPDFTTQDVTGVPADFLITPDGTIDTAYYGKDIGDHLDMAIIEQWLAR